MSHFPDELPAEPGQQHLRRALHELPSHEPDDALWRRIGAQLDTDAAVSRALPELPQHEPDDDLWAVIVGRLDHETPAPLTLSPAAEDSPVRPLGTVPAAAELQDTPERPAAPAEPLITPAAPATSAPAPALPQATRRWLARPWHWAASAAAAAVLMLVGAWWQHQHRAPAPLLAHTRPATAPEPLAAPVAHETISYGEEVLPADKAATARFAGSTFDPLQAQGVAFIDAHCTSLPTVCQSAQFQELRTELAALEAEEQRLQQAARRFGPSPELEQDRARVTTQKATITRELIQLLIS